MKILNNQENIEHFIKIKSKIKKLMPKLHIYAATAIGVHSITSTNICSFTK